MQETPSLQQFLYEHSLWWRLLLSSESGTFELSTRFQKRLGQAINNGTDFISSLTSESQTRLKAQIQAFQKGEVTSAKLVVQVVRPHHTIDLLTELHRVEQDDGKWLVAFCSEVTDVDAIVLSAKTVQTESGISENQIESSALQQQFHDQTQFLAMLSHELRSPLMGLNSLLDIVRQKLTERQHQKVAEELKVMKMTINQLNFLINDILTYAQTEFNQIHLNPTVFDLHEMADYICHLTKSIASEKGIDVRFSVATQNDCFYGDLVRLSQVLVNLIVNAIKFTQQGGVEVVIQEEDEFVEFHVKDSGEGIDEAELASIFTPFKQLDSRGGEQYVGSGLGLSIVKTLVDLMGGVLEVKSERGQGTDFSFVIPMRSGGCPDPTFVTPESAPVAPPVTYCDYQILVADDSAINRKVMQTFLKEMGCQVDEAEDGVQAWQKFQQHDYDYVFLDIQMPGLNGMEVCQKMRAFQQQKDHPVKGIFALTAAHTAAEVAGSGTEIDKSLFDAWLEKPASQDKIIHLLHCQTYSSIGYPKLSEDSPGKIENHSSDSQALPAIPEELVSLVPQLKDNVAQDIQAFQKALDYQTWAEAKAILHRIKGNLMLFELTEAVNLVRSLEALDQGLNREEIKIILKRLEKNLYDTYKTYL
ncbi:hypothetical protein CYQ88_06410 [Hydrogenovibrio sp. SC-1]|uniref:hybrid sensor histidine kinase/response regulator n=1 Tax=Hydrogenovibrio sp. SC-1 TaxID=2065820 RepID=UPI000C7BA164|nr:hybrid sensor histidine kinase/response regulator [Hydrogenovibrio sp. SC-1]PLA74317.1 hypothetical protein CYQ88_06410 [Hydrogenovibrio sp. SC-1]